MMQQHLRMLGAMLRAGAAHLTALGPTGARLAPPARHIRDATGRALVHRGMNTGNDAKGAADGMPAYPPAQIARERTLLGSSLVRLLVFWKHLEPEPGRYDRAYLDRVAALVDAYAVHGIGVILDLHQDLWVDNGPPAWAIHTDGLASVVPDAWELGYLTPGVNRAYDHFWRTNAEHPELMSHYEQAVSVLAERFRDHPGVFGYDLFNEPWPGSLPVHRFERDVLTPFYQRLIDRIRREDRDSWILVEPAALGANWGLPTRIGPFRDPRPGEPRIVYAPHFYSLPHDLRRHYRGPWKRVIDLSIRLWARTVVRDADRLGAPLLLGEYGLSFDDPGAGAFVARVQATLDDLGAGSVYWNATPADSWSPWAPDGAPGPGLDALARPYARAIPGVPVGMRAERTRRLFRLQYAAGSDPAPGASAEETVELWLPPRWYPHGVDVACSPAPEGWRWHWDAPTGSLTLHAPPVVGPRLIRVMPVPA
ncbi:MAG: cellulase family glycosylhydrolase [Actinobacteria bacterium]|nr:cellulase family glycosylhydrolase [Actinomycetota bacterium]